VLAGPLVAILVLLGACSSTAYSTRRQAPVPQASLLCWRQCLTRHGVTFPKAAKPAARAPFSREQLLRALPRNPKLRAEFGKALLKPPPGVAVAPYKTATTACLPRPRPTT
jgi:hypothetical protein